MGWNDSNPTFTVEKYQTGMDAADPVEMEVGNTVGGARRQYGRYFDLSENHEGWVNGVRVQDDFAPSEGDVVVFKEREKRRG